MSNQVNLVNQSLTRECGHDTYAQRKPVVPGSAVGLVLVELLLTSAQARSCSFMGIDSNHALLYHDVDKALFEVRSLLRSDHA